VPDIDIRRAHDLGRVAARRAAEQMIADLARKFDLRGQWQGDVLRFERPGVAGTLALTEKDLHLSISLGFLLKAMKASIEKSVLHELDTLFARPSAAAPVASAPTAKRPKEGS
jgi:putative polyhydroxyalkanoate system protein